VVRFTAVYGKLVSEEALRSWVCRRSHASLHARGCRPTLIMAAVWLVGQCNVFIRHREQLAMPPVSLKLDEPGVDRLSALISDWALSCRSRPNR
jgi:hypothetical protein